MIRQPSIVPWGAKVWDSQSSSTFQLRLPTNKFLMPSSPDASVLVFLTTGSASVSALRFLEGASSSSLSLESESESEESSESDCSFGQVQSQVREEVNVRQPLQP